MGHWVQQPEGSTGEGACSGGWTWITSESDLQARACALEEPLSATATATGKLEAVTQCGIHAQNRSRRCQNMHKRGLRASTHPCWLVCAVVPSLVSFLFHSAVTHIGALAGIRTCCFFQQAVHLDGQSRLRRRPPHSGVSGGPLGTAARGVHRGRCMQWWLDMDHLGERFTGSCVCAGGASQRYGYAHRQVCPPRARTNCM